MENLEFGGEFFGTKHSLSHTSPVALLTCFRKDRSRKLGPAASPLCLCVQPTAAAPSMAALGEQGACMHGSSSRYHACLVPRLKCVQIAKPKFN